MAACPPSTRRPGGRGGGRDRLRRRAHPRVGEPRDADTLIAANARVVDYDAGLALAQVWGGGKVASADGLRFVVPVRTISAGANPRYFGVRGGSHLRLGLLLRPGLRALPPLGAFGLVLNAIAVWNTRYMAAALDHLRATEGKVVTEDVERLSPLRHDHINLHGRYSFTPSDAVARGELRTLRAVGP